jgi:hypothetical protein
MENNPTDTPDNTGKEEHVIANFVDEIRQIQIEGYELRVRKARNALYWTAGLVFLAEMIGMARSATGFDAIVFVIALAEAGVFVALALWTKKKPYTAVLTGLIAFIGLIILSVVVNGIIDGSEGVLKALVGGIIIRVIILVNLISALGDARALQAAKEQND